MRHQQAARFYQAKASPQLVEFSEVFNAFVCHDCNSATSRFPEVEHPFLSTCGKEEFVPNKEAQPTEASSEECHCER